MGRHLAPRRRTAPSQHRVDVAPERRRRVTRRVATLVGLAAALLTGVAWISGVTPLVFTSGSMSPAISTGSLALSHTVEGADLRVGDVVSVASPDGERVTHRVVATQQRGEETVLVLRGDANADTDPQPYVVTSAERVVASVPVLGRVVTFLDGRAGLALLVVAGGAVLVSLRRPASTRHRERRTSVGGSVATLSVGALVACGALVAGAVPTAAYWTEVAVASSGTISTASPTPTPGGATCSDTGDHVLAGWTNVGQRYRYQLTLHRLDTGAQVGSAVSVPAATTASVASEIQRDAFGAGQPAASGQLNFTIRVRAVPVASTTWLSPTALSIPVRYTPAYAQLRCGNDTSTTVAITALGTDSGSSSTDFVTNVASNTLKGTGEAGATISVRRGGTQIATATVAADGTWTSTALTLTEGLQDLTAVATDLYGNTATATRTGVRLDTVAPVVTQAAPCAAGSVGNAVAGVSGATWCKVTSLTWTASFSDAGSGLDPTNGQQYSNAGSAFAAYPTGGVAMAEASGRVMVARATDLAGNSATASGTYYVDGTAPTITVTAPSATTYASAAGLRAAVTGACGAARVACGTVTETVSGVASTPAAQWSLRRTDTFAFLVPSTQCLNGNGYSSSCSATYPITVSGSTFSITSGSAASATIYPDRGFLVTGQDYRLTISGLADAAGNVGTGVVVDFGS